MNNLTQRILTAGVLIPVVLFLSFKAPVEWFAFFLLLVVGISFYEFFQLTKAKIPQILTTIIFAVAFLFMVLSAFASFMVVPIVFVIIAFWLKNTLMIISYPKIKPTNGGYLNNLNSVVLIIPLFLLIFLKLENTSLLLLLFLIVWGADSFAYIFGKLFGKHKLAPNVSGGKTIEGVVGGIVGVVFLTLIWMYFNQVDNYFFLLLAIITAIFSVVGDLYESIYKREAKVKDSGTILPGHGGILDRIDGLLAATPIFALGVFFI